MEKQNKTDGTVEENKQVAEIIEVLVLAFDELRAASFYGSLPLRRALLERLRKDGYTHVKSVVKAYHTGVKKRDQFRPSFTTPTAMLRAGWSRAVAFADRQRKPGGIAITDSSLRDDIARQLEKNSK